MGEFYWKSDCGSIRKREMFKWTVANTLLQTSETGLMSPEFFFEKHTCILGLIAFTEDDEEWIKINFWISPKNYFINVNLGVLFPDGEKYKCLEAAQYNDNDPRVLLYEHPELLSRSEVNRAVHFGQLIIFCEIEKQENEIDQLSTFDGILAA